MIDPISITVLTFVLFFVLLLLGVHIGVALGFCGLFGMVMGVGILAAIAQLITIPFAATFNFGLAVIPLFVLLGSLTEHAGFTSELYQAAYMWLRNLRGGLAMATIAAGAAFGAACGSTVVSAAIFTKISLPEMIKFGYNKGLSAGCIAASGTLASMIPPSVLFVIYGAITEVSIGKLLISGILPGILSAFMYIFGIIILSRTRRFSHLIPALETQKISFKEKMSSLTGVWGILVLFTLVMGGIYLGLTTPTHSGAVGAFGALILVILRRRMTFKSMLLALKDSATTTSVIFIIVVGGFLFARFLTYTGILTTFVLWSKSLGAPSYAYLGMYIILFLILGCFIEAIAIMLLTLPVLFPIMVAVGYDPIWLGVISIKLAEIGLVTPPVGLNVYVVKSASVASGIDLSLGEVFRGVTPFLLCDFVTMTLLIIFPQISLLLPSLMY
jgi:tripartite ATP-independent transporter DctM subunit